MATINVNIDTDWTDIKTENSLGEGNTYTIDNIGTQTMYISDSATEPTVLYGHLIKPGDSRTITIGSNGFWAKCFYESTTVIITLSSSIGCTGGDSGIEQDASTGSTKIIEHEHYEIHKGYHFFICDYQLNWGDGDTVEFIIQTPDTEKWAHMTLEFSSVEGATLEVYKGIDSFTGGTLVTPINNNGNSTNTSDLTITKDPSAITLGSAIRAAGFLAGGNKESGFNKRGREIILQQGVTFLFRFTSLAASNELGFCGEWYEHTNRSDI